MIYSVEEVILSTLKYISDFKIFCFSNIDFHKDYDLEKLIIVQNEIEEYQPDYIFYMGNLFKDSEVNTVSYYNLCSFFYSISRIAPVVLSLNNIEARSDDQQKVISRIEEFDHIKVIHNSTLCIDELIITGVDLSIYHFREAKKLLRYYQSLGEGTRSFSFYEIGLVYVPNVGKKKIAHCDFFEKNDMVLFENDKRKISAFEDELPSMHKIMVRKRIK